MARDNIVTNDRQLACARINSQEGSVIPSSSSITSFFYQSNMSCFICPSGQDYLAAMAAAANYAWVNRSSMTFLARQSFAKIFSSTPDDLDMHVIYDVSHNIAKVEQHVVQGERDQQVLVSSNFLYDSCTVLRLAEDSPSASQRQHSSVSSSSSTHSRRLSVHRPARAYWRHHGYLLLRPHRHPTR